MRAIRAEGEHTQACDRGARHGSPGTGADGEPREQGTPGELLRAFHWASRAPGAGEEEVPAEPGGLGAAAPQRGASLVASSGPPHCPPGAFAHLSVARCPLARLWVPGGSSPLALDPRPRTPTALGPCHRLPCASRHLGCGTGACPLSWFLRSHLGQPLGRNGVPKIRLPPRVRVPRGEGWGATPTAPPPPRTWAGGAHDSPPGGEREGHAGESAEAGGCAAVPGGGEPARAGCPFRGQPPTHVHTRPEGLSKVAVETLPSKRSPREAGGQPGSTGPAGCCLRCRS